ncbi:permease prefix domain 1-containing protein [Streptomyces sp. NPDC004539]|uniref:permease prefix domain 1-containing protein n=1 Tax=Streptomyces sp. NPDC004539 TaxID=3154280 RepID=UPI0033B789F2
MIEQYVAELDRALRGPRAVKADMLAEARDGLTDAAEAYEESGLDRASAERCAVADFGAVERIAPEFQAELALAQGRRTALLICGVLLAQPVVWWLLSLAGQNAKGGAGGVYGTADAVVGWAGGGAIVLALTIVVATGLRGLSAYRRLVRAAGFFAFAVCGVFAVLGGLLTVYNPAAHSLLGPAGLPTTALLLGVPLAAVAVAGRRCLTAA